MPLNFFHATQRLTELMVLGSLSVSTPSLTMANEPEREQLASLLRQLDLIQHSVDQSTVIAAHEHARYYLDYDRLHSDIARIRSGIQGYLTPERAQPRDEIPLFGDYSRETPTAEISP